MSGLAWEAPPHLPWNPRSTRSFLALDQDFLRFGCFASSYCSLRLGPLLGSSWQFGEEKESTELLSLDYVRREARQEGEGGHDDMTFREAH